MNVLVISSVIVTADICESAFVLVSSLLRNKVYSVNQSTNHDHSPLPALVVTWTPDLPHPGD